MIRKLNRLLTFFVVLLVMVLPFNSGSATQLGTFDTGDFSVSVSPNALSVAQGSSGTTSVTVNSLINFSGSVTLSISGLPAGVSVAFGTNPLTPPMGGTASSPLIIAVGGSVPATTYPLIVSSSNVTLTHSTVLTLTVLSSGAAPDFAIAISPSSITVPEGVSTTTTAIVTSVGSFSSAVTLSASGAPSGLILTFQTDIVVPSPGGSATSVISIMLEPWVAPGPYSITITGTSGSITHSATLGVFIAPVEDYLLTANPSTLSLTQGTSASTTITTTSYNGYSSPIQLSTFWISSTPYGVYVNTPSTIPPQNFRSVSLTLTVTASNTASVGTFTLRVTASGGPVPQSVDITIQVASATQPTQDFGISMNPQSITIVQGSPSSAIVTIQSLGSFSSPVTLSSSGVPVGVSVAFSTNPLTPSSGGIAQSTMTITTSGVVPATTYGIMITALSGSIFHSAVLSLIITSAVTPSFSLSSSKSLIAVTQGQSGTDTIIVDSQAGFSSSVTLSVSWLSTSPAGVTLNIQSPVAPNPNTVASSTLTIAASNTASTGNFTVRVVGISGAVLDSVDVAVEINAPQCLIATATYGSSLSPEVQFLRDFRDNIILKTSVGSNFMLAFNMWYYSFSPTVAQSVSQDFELRAAMEYFLSPLISILKFGASIFYVVPANTEVGAVVSGLMISSLIGATYIAFPLTLMRVCTRRVRLRAKKLERLAAMVMVAALVTLALAEFSGKPSIVLILASSVLVLATMTLSGLLTSRVVVRMLAVVRRKF